MLPPPPPFDEEIVSWCAAHEILLDALRRANACAGELERARAPRPAAWHVPALPVGVANRVCPTSADDGDAERRARAVAAHESALARACDARDDAAAALAEFEERAARARRALRASARERSRGRARRGRLQARPRASSRRWSGSSSRAPRTTSPSAPSTSSRPPIRASTLRARGRARDGRPALPAARARVGRMRRGLGEGGGRPRAGNARSSTLACRRPRQRRCPRRSSDRARRPKTPGVGDVRT